MKKINTILTLFLIISISRVGCQPIQVGIIDFYGLGVNYEELKKCLTFSENDTIQFLTDSATYVGANKEILGCFVTKQPEIKHLNLSFICCVEGSKWIVYVGIGTEIAQTPQRNRVDDIKLSTEITNIYDSLMKLILVAAQHGEAGDDGSNGHSLMDYLPARNLQEKFIKYAEANLNLLRNVLKDSKYDDQRAVSATVIAYYHDKAEIIDDLLEAVTDSNPDVRNNSMNAIGLIAEYSQSRPTLKIEIPADPFIVMINSILWSDRNKSASILRVLSTKREKKILLKLKNDALGSLIEIASWKSEGHSNMGYLILGRIAGWTEQAIVDSYKKNRSEMIQQMLTTIN